MGRYLIRRLLFMILVLFVVAVFTFLIFLKLPAGDPARRAAGKAATADAIEAARHALGLDLPSYVQFGRFAKGLIPWPGLFLNKQVYFSFGDNVPVRDEIFKRFPITVTLAVGGAVVWLAMGIPIGIASAIKRRTIVDVDPPGPLHPAVDHDRDHLGRLLRAHGSRQHARVDVGGLHPYRAGERLVGTQDDL